MKHTITVTETLSRKVEIEADSYEEAIQTISQKYNNEEIVLGEHDYSNVEIN